MVNVWATADVSDSELRPVVADLIIKRYEKYYHWSTRSHIVRQREGTEIGPLPIKGFGNFPDLAYRDYIGNTNAALKNMQLEELLRLKSVLEKYPPEGIKKLEVQVEMPLEIIQLLNAQAAERKISLCSLINTVVVSNLPKSKGEVHDWLSKTMTLKGGTALQGWKQSGPNFTVVATIDADPVENITAVANNCSPATLVNAALSRMISQPHQIFDHAV